MKKLAIIQFPGSNCELETLRAGEYFGFLGEIIRWNESPDKLFSFDAYILPGGFSYQDRVRAGVIASKLPIVNFLKEADKREKPILGICNGCQILAEAGLVPDFNNDQKIETALSPNHNKEEVIGFICDWVYVRIENAKNNIFTYYFDNKTVIPVPINNAEGRFVFKGKSGKSLDQLTMIKYCDAHGEILDLFPTNPNGSVLNMAGISNQAGNVLAMMPHPERAVFLKQIPFWLESKWSEKKRHKYKNINEEGPWAKLFLALYDRIKK